MEEIARIREIYKRRDFSPGNLPSENTHYERFKNLERERVYRKIIHNHFIKSFTEIDVLEIGAGKGNNIEFFLAEGFNPEKISANELLPWRSKELRRLFPGIKVLEGDATLIETSQKFDIILQSLVFSSILDMNFKILLSDKMIKLLKPGGMIIWYDFIFNNPRNPDVKSISKKEIKLLFPNSRISFWPVTLAPPIGRRIGRMYNVINKIFPIFRTHLVGQIEFGLHKSIF